MLAVLSWNIRQGGGSRIRQIVQKIAKSKAQVVVLSEFRNSSKGSFLRNKLLEFGYRYQFVTQAESGENSVLVCSQFPANSRLFSHVKWDYSQNIIAIDFPAFSLYGMYLPHKKKHRLFDLLLDETKSHKPAILVGDFNTGKNYIDQKGDSFWYTDKLEMLEEQDIVDAFRYLHPNAKEYSWYSHQGNGYRYDHSYLHKDLLPILHKCYYFHEWRDEGISDHSAMMLELKS
jgi:exonuclease III